MREDISLIKIANHRFKVGFTATGLIYVDIFKVASGNTGEKYQETLYPDSETEAPFDIVAYAAKKKIKGTMHLRVGSVWI